MPTLGVLDSTFGVVEKGTNALNIIHNPLAIMKLGSYIKLQLFYQQNSVLL